MQHQLEKFKEYQGLMGAQLDEINQRVNRTMWLGSLDEGPSGRAEAKALPYESPFEGAVDLIDDILDAEFVAYMKEAPADPLDQELLIERHVESCEECKPHYCQTCAHCLELRVCREQFVSVGGYLDMNEDGRYSLRPSIITLELCRRCRNTTRDGYLDLEKARD